MTLLLRVILLWPAFYPVKVSTGLFYFLGLVFQNGFPWATMLSIIGSIVFVGFLVGLGWWKRKTTFMEKFIDYSKKAAFGVAFGFLGCLILLVFPFLWIFQYFKVFLEMVYGNFRYRNE